MFLKQKVYLYVICDKSAIHMITDEGDFAHIPGRTPAAPELRSIVPTEKRDVHLRSPIQVGEFALDNLRVVWNENWDAGIRTPTGRARVCSPTIRRRPTTHTAYCQKS